MSIKLRPIRREDYEPLLEAAHADDHNVISPTHVMWKPAPDGGEEIVGYASVNAMPILGWWLDRNKGTARDTLTMREAVDQLFVEQGHPIYFTSLASNSPYRPFMARLGCKHYSWAEVFIRDLTEVTAEKKEVAV